jgi:hypothetical protein
MATWMVQGCRSKIQEIVKEMERLGIDIASITETKKKGSGSEIIGNYLHFYSGVPEEIGAKGGVSLLIHRKWKHNITNWQCIDERIITMNINIYISIVKPLLMRIKSVSYSRIIYLFRLNKVLCTNGPFHCYVLY